MMLGVFVIRRLANSEDLQVIPVSRQYRNLALENSVLVYAFISIVFFDVMQLQNRVGVVGRCAAVRLSMTERSVDTCIAAMCKRSVFSCACLLCDVVSDIALTPSM